jgi:hypothetical protein
MIYGVHFIMYSTDHLADQEALQSIFDSFSVPAMGGRKIVAIPKGEIATHPGEFTKKHSNEELLGSILYLMCDDIEETVNSLIEKNINCGNIEKTDFGLKTSITLPSGGKIGLYQPSHEIAIKQNNQSIE